MSDKLIVERLQDIRICDIGLRRVAANRIKALTEQYEEAYQYAFHLAKALRENYPSNPDFRFLGDLVGLLTQIDNMVAGLPKPAVQPAHVNETPKSEHDAANMLTLTAERDRLRGALADIVSWETMHANATVTRMANHARYALKGETP